MIEITYSRPGDWDAVMPATQGISHRSTTSSRLPGRAIEGSVHYRIAQISPCASCGGMAYETTTGYPHGVRWAAVNGRHIKIDCVGREVTR